MVAGQFAAAGQTVSVDDFMRQTLAGIERRNPVQVIEAVHGFVWRSRNDDALWEHRVDVSKAIGKLGFKGFDSGYFAPELFQELTIHGLETEFDNQRQFGSLPLTSADILGNFMAQTLFSLSGESGDRLLWPVFSQGYVRLYRAMKEYEAGAVPQFGAAP